MSLLSKNKFEKVFISKNSVYKSTQKIDIILSPEFYWIRKIEIPVPNSKEAIKILPTLFEDILPQNQEFDYYAINLKENYYLCFAYNSEDITNLLKNIGINISHINSIYFSQNELNEYNAFNINENAYIFSDDILVKLPQNLKNDFINIENKIPEIKLSQHKISVKFFSNLLNEKYINLIITLALVIILINSFKYYDISRSIQRVYSKIESEKRENALPATLLQTNSIINSISTKVKKEIKFRNAIEYILEFKKISNQGKIEKIEFSNNSIKINFQDIDYKSVKNYLLKKYTIINDRVIDNNTKVEIKL